MAMSMKSKKNCSETIFKKGDTMMHPTAPDKRRKQMRRSRFDNADRVLDDFIASVARRLRVPLRSILRSSRLTREYAGVLDDATGEY